MSIFARGLRDANIESLRKLADDRAPNWWKDLLSLWKRSGEAAGRDGIRLAVRDDYLNFYSMGQSIALVGFGKDGPYAKVHHKYLIDGAEGQRYLTLKGSRFHGARKVPVSGLTEFVGIEDVRDWVRRASNFTGEEKKRVDELVATCSRVVDLEAAVSIPAKPDSRSNRPVAKRIDLVSVESQGGVKRLVFWEVKLGSDARIVSKSRPKVLEQLEDYRSYISKYRSVIEDAYRKTCLDLIQLDDMARALGASSAAPLAPELVEIANGSAWVVDERPRLLVLHDKPVVNKNWDAHRHGIEAAGYGIFDELT